jgi:hypothetical protein
MGRIHGSVWGIVLKNSDILTQQMSCIERLEGFSFKVQTSVSFAFTHPLALHLLSCQCTEQTCLLTANIAIGTALMIAAADRRFVTHSGHRRLKLTLLSWRTILKHLSVCRVIRHHRRLFRVCY